MATGVATLGIGDVWLDFEFYWTNEFDMNKVAMKITPTIDGGSSIQYSDASSIVKRMVFQGHAYYSTVNSLKALSESVGTTYACTFREADMGTITFDSSEGAAVSFQPAYLIATPASDDLFAGTIKLVIP